MPHSVIFNVRRKTQRTEGIRSSVATAGSQGGSLVIGHLMRLVWTSRVNE